MIIFICDGSHGHYIAIQKLCCYTYDMYLPTWSSKQGGMLLRRTVSVKSRSSRRSGQTATRSPSEVHPPDLSLVSHPSRARPFLIRSCKLLRRRHAFPYRVDRPRSADEWSWTIHGFTISLRRPLQVQTSQLFVDLVIKADA